MVTSRQVREWMDRQIEAVKILKEVIVIEKHEDDIDDVLRNLTINATDGIHIGAEAVRYIADKLDMKMWVQKRDRDSSNPYEISILYKGTMFYGIETEEEYRYRGAVV